MSENEPAEIGQIIPEAILRAFPVALAAYDELKAEHRRQLEAERRDFKGVLRYFKKRGAKPDEYMQLQEERQRQIVQIESAFRQRVKELVEGLVQRPGS